MRRRDFLKGSLLTGLAASAVRSATAGPTSEADPALIVPVALTCESMHNPLGIDTPRPRLSWKLEAAPGARGQEQSAYRITVASTESLLLSDTPDLWDSGPVASARQLHIDYEGRLLTSGQRCFWRVQVWDGTGRTSDPSRTAWWEMALLSPSDWSGVWISDGSTDPPTDAAFYDKDPAPLFRRTFRIEKPVRRARLYAVGLGYGAFRLNGQPVADRVLDPAWTAFEDRVHYTCDDLTDRLQPGENVLGAMLGNGWFNPLPLRMWGRINVRDHLALGRPQLKANLVIEYEDGEVYTVASDASWKVSPGPILRNSVYLGEEYDARLEQRGWDGAGFSDEAWRPATPSDSAPSGALCALPIPPIRVTATLTPVSITEVTPGVWIFDLGQNFAGWARLRVTGPRGTTVRMRMGERIHEDGTLNPMTAVAGQIKGLNQDGSPRGGPGAPEVAWQVNSYTLRGGGPEEYTPRFTFHGFRYVEVTGFPGTPTLETIEGLRLNSDVDPAGSFACSNDRLNRIQEMVRWTLLSNLFSVQSDCPAREKFQYGGDIVATSEMAIFNYDMATFYGKTVADHADAVRGQGWFTETAPYVGISAANYEADAGPIGWGLAHPLLVAQLYQYYGDRRVVEDQFKAACTWVDLLEAHADGFIIDRCIGDHESLDPKPIELIGTAQFYQAATLVAGFAGILERTEEALRYRRLAANIRDAFLNRFLEPGTGQFGIATQAAQATALQLGLAPETELDAAVRRMVEQVVVEHGGHVATGIFGTKYLLDALSKAGRSDVAYQMVDQNTYSGWGYMLERGATTVWETWAESDNVYSNNHPMFGSVSEWFFKSLAGIRPEDHSVGFDRFRIEPDMPEGLEWVEASYESVRGTIRSRWRLDEQHAVVEIEVPVNTQAAVRLPLQDSASVLEGGRPIEEAHSIRRLPPTSRGEARFEVGSGRYSFSGLAR